jgi:hypothetical protein
MREELAEASSRVCVAVAHVLAEIGSLNDIGLFSDLLSLPEWQDEERGALLFAMCFIAERSSAPVPRDHG